MRVLQRGRKMARTASSSLTLVVSVLIMFGILGCSDKQVAVEESEPMKPDPFVQRLISAELLKEVRLENVWEYRLPMESGESVADMYVRGDQLYVRSDRNHMFSVDRHNGERKFDKSLGHVGFFVLGFELYDNELISIVGNRLLQIDAQTGREIAGMDVKFGVTCPAARNKDSIYIAGSDHRMHMFTAKGKVDLFQVAAQNGSGITSVAAGDDMVIFGTDVGNVISIQPDQPRKLWQFDASDSIAGQMVREDNWLYLASKDTYIYKVNVENGDEVAWKYQTTAMLDKGPRITRNILYQRVGNKGLTAVDKASGEKIWHVDGGIDLAADSGVRSYVMRDGGELVVMDNMLKKQLKSVVFPGVSRFGVNLLDSKMYFAGKEGRIVCLQPME